MNCEQMSDALSQILRARLQVEKARNLQQQELPSQAERRG